MIRSEELFSALRSRIPKLLPKGASVDIRGLGLMIGIEFSGVPAGFASQIASEARDKHDMLLLTTSIYETLRLIPPLNVTKEETADAIERIIKSVEGAVRKI